MNELINVGILAGIILAILVYHAYYVREVNKEKSKLINALISKNATELRDLELTEKVEPIKTAIDKPSDLVPEAEMTDEEFKKSVLDKEVG